MNVKKLLLALVVVFVGFWLFQDPNGLAAAASVGAESAWGLLTQLFTAVIDFVGAF